jgi:hypothetical protein
MPALDPMIARRTWMTLEPIHGMVYFSPHGGPAYESIGLLGRSAYFASRAAAMGPVGPEVITATFFNFAPTLVRESMTSVWSSVSPEQVVATRLKVVDASLREAAPGLIGSDAIASAAELVRRAAISACGRVDGKALFAAHAALPWPTELHLSLWHGQTLLREYRGDIHIALLVSEGLSGLEALITHAATGAVPADMLRTLRGWTEDEWNTAVEALRARSILSANDLTLSAAGEALRQRLEDRTDALSADAWAVLGDDGCKALRAAARPLSAAVIDAGWSPLRKLPPAED